MALSEAEIKALNGVRLLAKIAEESSEVCQAAMKFLAHGPRPEWNGVQYNNVRDVNDEFSQLESLIAELRRRYGRE